MWDSLTYARPLDRRRRGHSNQYREDEDQHRHGHGAVHEDRPAPDALDGEVERHAAEGEEDVQDASEQGHELGLRADLAQDDAALVSISKSPATPTQANPRTR